MKVGVGVDDVVQRHGFAQCGEICAGVAGEATYGGADEMGVETDEEVGGVAGDEEVGLDAVSVAVLVAFDPSVAPSVRPFEEASLAASN